MATARVEGAEISNCHVEQGTVHVHHDANTANAVAAVARALEANANALGHLAQAIVGSIDRPLTNVSGYGVALGCDAPKDLGLL